MNGRPVYVEKRAMMTLYEVLNVYHGFSNAEGKLQSWFVRYN